MNSNNFISLIILIILWCIGVYCSDELKKHIPKKQIFVMSSIIYTFIIIIYVYCNIEECYEHVATINIQLAVLLVAIAMITILSGGINYLLL